MLSGTHHTYNTAWPHCCRGYRQGAATGRASVRRQRSAQCRTPPAASAHVPHGTQHRRRPQCRQHNRCSEASYFVCWNLKLVQCQHDVSAACGCRAAAAKSWSYILWLSDLQAACSRLHPQASRAAKAPPMAEAAAAGSWTRKGQLCRQPRLAPRLRRLLRREPAALSPPATAPVLMVSSPDCLPHVSCAGNCVTCFVTKLNDGDASEIPVSNAASGSSPLPCHGTVPPPPADSAGSPLTMTLSCQPGVPAEVLALLLAIQTRCFNCCSCAADPAGIAARRSAHWQQWQRRVPLPAHRTQRGHGHPGSPPGTAQRRSRPGAGLSGSKSDASSSGAARASL